MKIEYNNLYTHYVFTTLGRQFLIPEKKVSFAEEYEQFLKHYQDTLKK